MRLDEAFLFQTLIHFQILRSFSVFRLYTFFYRNLLCKCFNNAYFRSQDVRINFIRRAALHET